MFYNHPTILYHKSIAVVNSFLRKKLIILNENFMLIPSNLINKLSVSEIISCNDLTYPYGLKLSLKDAVSLVETRTEALKSNGRIEFKGGIINKLITEFCNSPYISQFNYAETISDLIETFYYFKNETLDELSDDELISLMKDYFDHNCQGSMELLQHRELEKIAKSIRYGGNIEEEEEDYE